MTLELARGESLPRDDQLAPAERNLEEISRSLSAAAFAKQTKEGRIAPTEEEVEADIERLTGDTPFTD